MRAALRLAAPAALVLALAGCVSFGGDAPDRLLTLTSDASAAAGTNTTGTSETAIAMADFEAPQKLDVTRVPVQVSDSEIAYVKDAVWVEKPARLLRRLIAETIRADSGRLVIDGDDPGALASTRLSGTLREFGFDARTGEAVLVFDAALATEGSRVTTRRFQARIPGVIPEAGPVGVALNQAANDVAAEVSAWAR